jgi:hypothetical protein
MALTPGAVGAIAASTGGSVTPATPAGSASDMLIMHVSHYAGGTDPVPYDFTANAHEWQQIAQEVRTNTGTQIAGAAYGCRRGAAYPGDPTFHTSVVGGNALYARIFVVADSNPFAGVFWESPGVINGGAGTKTGPTVTPLGANRLIFNLFSVANAADLGDPTGGFAALYEDTNTLSFDTTMAADYLQVAGLDPVPGTTRAGGNWWVGMGFALFGDDDAPEPPVGGGGGVPIIAHHLKMQGMM